MTRLPANGRKPRGTGNQGKAPGYRIERDGTVRVRYMPPVRYGQIRGAVRISLRYEAPTVEWGHDGERWCFLHDLDDASLLRLMDDFRVASEDRRGQW